MSPVFKHGGLRLYLLVLLDEGPKHGYDLIVALEERFLGTYSPSAGTIYPRLTRLEEEGLVTHEDTPDGRKIYRITPAGHAELERRGDEVRDLARDIEQTVRELARELRRDVGESVQELRQELRAAAREVRRESRAARRTDSFSTNGSLDADINRLVRQVKKAAARASDEVALDRARLVLRQAATDAVKALTGHDEGGS